MMDGPQRNINAADLNHFKCKCLSRGVMQMRIEWKRLKLFPLLNANMFLTPLGGFVMGKVALTGKKRKMNKHKKETVVLQNEICDSNCYKTISSNTKEIVFIK